jgi:hypothetical protein
MTDLSIPAALDVSGSQWAIKLPDGRVNPTETGKDRTERDAEWEDGHPYGHGGPRGIDHDAYQTPWGLAGAPAPVVAPCEEAGLAQAAQVPALHAPGCHLRSLLLYYRHLAAEQTEADLLHRHPRPGPGGAGAATSAAGEVAESRARR